MVDAAMLDGSVLITTALETKDSSVIENLPFVRIARSFFAVDFVPSFVFGNETDQYLIENQ